MISRIAFDAQRAILLVTKIPFESVRSLTISSMMQWEIIFKDGSTPVTGMITPCLVGDRIMGWTVGVEKAAEESPSNDIPKAILAAFEREDYGEDET